jgi:hemerythrin-like domain-containing protein
MTPTEILKHEHKIILMVLDAAKREVQSIRQRGKVHIAELEKIVDFIRNFADRCHHAKEENLLFVKMKEKGMPSESGPIAVMLKEHTEGRRRIKAIGEAIPKAKEGDPSALQTISKNLEEYILLLRNHIDKEDNVLYPMADKVLTEQDQQSLSEAFDKVEAEEIGEGVHEKYHKLAHELSEFRLNSSEFRGHHT